MPAGKRFACEAPGCGRVTPPGRRRCERHARTAEARPSAPARGYDRRWQKVRMMHLRADPFCVVCGRVATEVDHKTPLAAGGTHEPSNLQSMCKSCHARKTATEQRSTT